MPNRELAFIVLPEYVGVPITIEIPRTDNPPTHVSRVAWFEQTGSCALRSVHGPDGNGPVIMLSS